MRANGDAHEVANDIGFRLVADRDADLTVFSPAELTLVDSVLDRFRGHNATDIRAESHREIGWAAAEPNDVIPYASYLLAPVTDDNISRARLVVETQGWAVEVA